MYAVSFLWQFPYVMAIAWNVPARGEVRDDLVFTALAKASRLLWFWAHRVWVTGSGNPQLLHFVDQFFGMLLSTDRTVK